MTDHAKTSIRLPLAFIDALSHADGLEPVLTVGAQWLTRLFPATRGSIAFFDDDRFVARVARADGRVDPPFDMGEIAADSPRSRVLCSGQPVVLAETDLAQTHIRPLQLLHRSGINSMLIAPLLGGGEAVGTLTVSHNRPQGYSDRQVEVLIGIGRFIASQARLMQQVRSSVHQAETDALTRLANRTRLMRVLNGPMPLHVPDANGQVVGVLHVDLDHFKEVNDTLGHAAGDAILRHAARAMQDAAGPKDLVARVGGDEFIVVTRTDSDGRRIALLADRIAEAVVQPLRIGDVEARVGASIGTALAMGADCTAERLIGNADIALYQVKRQGRGGIRAFCRAMREAAERRTQLLSDLHLAVEQRQFEPYFHPQVSMATGHFSGFEMLARWSHPKLGIIDPDDFIGLAAEAGLSEKIDDIVRAKGLAALRDLRAQGWDAPKMSFNASARTLKHPQLVENLLREVQGQGLEPGDLVLEVREADLIKLGSDRAIDHINALSKAGFDVELDDFGADHAAMINLGRLSISGVKLDRSFIASLPAARAKTITRAVVGMAKELGLNVTAEGVETTAQFSTLHQMGCDVAQGFGVSKPLPMQGLIAFMEGYGRAPVTLAQRATDQRLPRGA